MHQKTGLVVKRAFGRLRLEGLRRDRGPRKTGLCSHSRLPVLRRARRVGEGSGKKSGMTLEAVKADRRREAENAAKALGVRDILFYDLGDYPCR